MRSLLVGLSKIVQFPSTESMLIHVNCALAYVNSLALVLYIYCSSRYFAMPHCICNADILSYTSLFFMDGAYALLSCHGWSSFALRSLLLLLTKKKMRPRRDLLVSESNL